MVRALWQRQGTRLHLHVAQPHSYFERPLGPTMPKSSPCRTSNEMSSTATISSYRLAKSRTVTMGDFFILQNRPRVHVVVFRVLPVYIDCYLFSDRSHCNYPAPLAPPPAAPAPAEPDALPPDECVAADIATKATIAWLPVVVGKTWKYSGVSVHPSFSKCLAH